VSKTFAVWGVHPLDGTDFAAGGDLLILERPGVGGVRQYGGDRERLKAALRASYPRERERTLGQWAGTLLRFAALAADGDLVVHPNRLRRTFSVGRLVGEYFWLDAEPVDQHLRRVQWVRRGIPRDSLSARAQKAISGRAAFFSAEGAAQELLALQ
jgi:predicted Mrr-cat superfamily restriction endonuclease